MKKSIKKRTYANPMGSSTLFLIPILTYMTGKMVGIEYNKLEWIWPLFIAMMIIFWFFVNYKIIKNEKD